MDSLVVRLARTSDAVDLARNWTEAAHHYVELDPEAAQVPSTDGLVDFFKELLGRPRSEDSVWLVAEIDGQVIGDVSARLERPAKDAERQVMRYPGEIRVYVDALGVAEAFRREGVGTRLIQAIEQWGRDRSGGETAVRSASCWTPTPGARFRCRSTSGGWATGGGRLSSRSGSTSRSPLAGRCPKGNARRGHLPGRHAEAERDTIPTYLRDLFAFRCTTPQMSDTILGAGWSTAGYTASTIDAAHRGVGYLLHEGAGAGTHAHLQPDGDDLTQLARRAEALRAAHAKPAGPVSPWRWPPSPSSASATTEGRTADRSGLAASGCGGGGDGTRLRLVHDL